MTSSTGGPPRGSAAGLRAGSPARRATPEVDGAATAPSGPGLTLCPSVPDVLVADALVAGQDAVLAPEALALVGLLHRRFADGRGQLLASRPARRAELARAIAGAGGVVPTPTRAQARDLAWRAVRAPAGWSGRHVEVVCPPTPVSAAAALACDAAVWVADLGDAAAPSWHAGITGQAVLARSVAPDTGSPRQRPPIVVVRPRGWHLDEPDLLVGGSPAVAALVDVGLHAAAAGAAVRAGRGQVPCYSLPALEGAPEARLWDDVLAVVEHETGLAPGSIRVSVVVETVPGAAALEDIAYALRGRLAGLETRRWTYLVSVVRTLRDVALARGAAVAGGAHGGPTDVLPDRAALTMAAPFLAAYADLVVATARRHGLLALGDVSTFAPGAGDAAADERGLARVRAEKTRELWAGFDGLRVADPRAVRACAEVVDAGQAVLSTVADPEPEPDPDAARARLLDLTGLVGRVTETGLRDDVSLALRQRAAWSCGDGTAVVDSTVVDAATAEFCRAQVEHWLAAGVTLETGTVVTPDLLARVLREEAAALAPLPGLEPARALLSQALLSEDVGEFLPLARGARAG